jgi:hypothetical protein
MYRLRGIVFVLISCLTSPLHAGETDVDNAAVDAEDAAVDAEDAAIDSEDAAAPARIDRLHSGATNIARSIVGRVDAFFVTEDYATFGENESRVRLRLDTDYIEHHGWDFKPRVKLHLVLPGMNERMRLVVNDADNDEDGQTADVDDDENDVALRLVGREGESSSLTYDLGLRIRGGKLDPFARVNAGVEYILPGKWTGQTTNRLYYYRQGSWRNDFRQHFSRPLSDNLLFRSRSRLQYFDENIHRFNSEQKFSLFHTLASQSALAYEVWWRQESAEDSVFRDSEIVIPPQKKYQKAGLQLRYRRRFLRPWLFFEVWPVVAWAEERDWDMVLGARLRLEINLGSHGNLKLDQ